MNLTELKTGDVVLVRTIFKPLKPLTWPSIFIRTIDETFYNHVKAVTVEDGIPYFIEADFKVIKTPASIEKDVYSHYIVRRPTFNFNEEIFIENANKHVEKTTYDYFGTFFFQLVYQLTGIAHRKWHQSKSLFGVNTNHSTKGVWLRKKEPNDKVYCSSFYAYLHNMYQPERVSPQDLLNSPILETTQECL